ncbi:DMT family transporter [Kitasatospora cheerisanensis]|uniref:Membrane protein n=1 Tax=Kitasatospora cheerisanensis KCTC 2395 TaxID=1348663 RepID=A0A066YKD3_9ACTN|nr:DMT family transporter [Kitasatospora cheerisanensis]KDN81938.1 membrane protein [Kitasatospora cheerisanensis KCTC 2395]
MSQDAVPVVVLAAALLHAVWNALVHGVRDRLAGVALMNLVFVAFGAVSALFVPLPGARALPYLLASTALQVGYQLLLARAYRLGDFGQMYPIARGTSPAVVALLAATVLHHPVPAGQAVAVVVISLGLAGLALAGGWPRREQLPALAAALGTGVLIACYTVVDGNGVRAANSTGGYLAWMFVLQGLAVLAAVVAVRGRTLLPALREGRAASVAGGLMSLTAYGLVVWAQTVGDLPTIAALRETSIVIAALIGTLVLRERLGTLRLAASATVLTGIALLELAH